MFNSQEQISKVAKRNEISPDIVKKLAQMMSRVKIAQENLQMSKYTPDKIDIVLINNAHVNLKEALSYFENDFLKCKLW